MNTCIASLSRFVAAVRAPVIMAVSAWPLVSSSVSIERNPIQVGPIMTANAKVRTAQVHRGTPSTCPNNPEIWDPLAPMCLRG